MLYPVREVTHAGVPPGAVGACGVGGRGGRRGAVEDALVDAESDGRMVGGGLGVIPLSIGKNHIR